MVPKGSAVGTAPTFDRDVKALSAQYTDLPAQVDDLIVDLQLGYLDSVASRVPSKGGVWAVHVDYPPLGSGGVNKFIAAYRVVKPKPNNGFAEDALSYTLIALRLT